MIAATLGRMTKLDLVGWLYSLLAAVIGGGSSSVVAGVAATIVDPRDFGASWKTLQLMGMTFLVSAILHLFTFLAKSPLPPLVEVQTTTSTSTVTGTGDGGKVIEKVEQKITETKEQ